MHPWSPPHVVAANADLAQALKDATVDAGKPRNHGTATVDPNPGHALQAAHADLADAKDTSRATPTHLPLGQVRPGTRLLETERKLLTHAIRMSAYNPKCQPASGRLRVSGCSREC